MEKTKEIGKNVTDFALNTIKNWAEYILVLLTFLECNSLFYFYAGREATNEKFLRFGILAVTFFLLCFRYLETKEGKSLIKLLPTLGGMYVLMGAFLVLNVMRKTDLLFSYFILFLFFLPAVTVFFYLDRVEGKPYNLIYKYADIVAVYAFLAVIIYLFSVFFGGKMPESSVLTHWSNKGNLKSYTDYFGIVCISTDKIFSLGGFDFYKMLGIFPEPPMAMIPLITALYAELFLKKNKSGAVAVVFLTLAVVFTGSTLGYMLLILAFAIFALKKVPTKFRTAAALVLAAAACLLAAILFFGKKKNAEGSFSAHIEDYYLCFRAFLKSPLFGNAFGNDTPILEFMSETRYADNPGLSNAVGVVFAQGGLLLGAICMLPLVRGLLGVFSKDEDERNEGLFFVGITALYIVTIFTYRFFLIFVMAFGYALVPFKREAVPQRVFTDKISLAKKVEYALGAVFVLSIAVTAGGIWKSIFAFFKSNSLLLSQSAWNLIFVLVFVIGFVVMLSLTINEKNLTYAALTAFMLLTGIVTLVFRAQIVTGAKSFCDVMKKTSYTKLFIVFVYLLAFVCVYALVWCVLALKKKQKLYGIVFAVFPFAFIILVSRVITGNAGYYTEQVEEDSDALSIVVSASSGKVYSDTLPHVYMDEFPEISLSTKSGAEFSQLDNISVLMTEDLREMFREGFTCFEVNDNRALYTNDSAVIDAMESNGYKAYNHYPNSLSVDLYSLAKSNGMEANSDGYIELNGDSAEITHGPSIALDNGTYLVTFNIHSDEKCKVTVSALKDGTVMRTKTRGEDAYNEYGNVSLTLKIKASDLNNLEFNVHAEGSAVLKKIAYKQKAEYDKINYCDDYNRIVKTEYRKNGEPYSTEEGYSSVEYEYDKKGNVVSKKYFDELGKEVSVNEA